MFILFLNLVKKNLRCKINSRMANMKKIIKLKI